MVIRRSAGAEIRQLVDRLLEGDPASREAASARLAIIGPRAARALSAALHSTGSPVAQSAILRTLEAIRDPHSVAPASQFVESPDVDVASAAVDLLRRFLRYDDATLADAAFERLTAVTLDPTRPEPVRAAALEALSDLPAETSMEVRRQLEEDPSARLRGAAAGHESVAAPRALAEITEASRCPDPVALRALLAAEGRRAPLAVLARVLELLRAREEAETASSRRTEWQAARAAVHQVLADRRSRVALYDLRESLSVAPGPLPVGFVAALERIGDASCLDSVAAAYLRARGARDEWWIEHLARIFREILHRERLTRRSAAVKRVVSKYPQAAGELLPRGR